MIPDFIYTGLIDVLSYRSRLEEDRRSGGSKFKDDLEGALSVFDTVNSAVYSVNAISDTVILTCNNHNNFIEFLQILRNVFKAFMRKGLLIRGGVAYSKHFQSGRLTYSHAVARAYELESKVAIYPRIVIDDNIIQMYSSGTGLPALFNKGWLMVHNGITFLDVIEQTEWNEYHNLAAQIYERDKYKLQMDENAFSKHQWFENYLFDHPSANMTEKRYIEKMSLK